MRLKQRIGDFRVRELIVDGHVKERGDHRVYRVTKRKLTSTAAARILAEEAGVETGDVSLAGLKDRQGITIQHMSVPGGRLVRLRTSELIIEPIGFADEEMRSEFSLGNAFEIAVRGLELGDIDTLRKNVPAARRSGVVNYFDDQRFGNLRHDQGWIARDLMRGKHEKALKSLLTGSSPHEDERERRFKVAIGARWGDWRACRDLAGRYGRHHSIFEHLGRNPVDFAGAFYHVASRLRLIHLYAYQSHIWNRAVCDMVRRHAALEARVVLDSTEGTLVTHAGDVPEALARVFRLPGEGLEDVRDEEQLRLLEDVLARERMVPDQFRIEGVPGFQLKGEDRPLVLVPRFLRVRPPERDVLNRGLRMVKLRFELPRGSYATLLVKRLLARPFGEHKRADPEPLSDPRRSDVGRPWAKGAPEGTPRGGAKGGAPRGRKGSDSRPRRKGSGPPRGKARKP